MDVNILFVLNETLNMFSSMFLNLPLIPWQFMDRVDLYKMLKAIPKNVDTLWVLFHWDRVAHICISKMK